VATRLVTIHDGLIDSDLMQRPFESWNDRSKTTPRRVSEPSAKLLAAAGNGSGKALTPVVH